MNKPTMKNMLVFSYYQAKNDGYKNYKQVFNENQAEILEKFGVGTYGGFRQHCQKAFKAIQNGLIDWSKK